MEITIRDYEPLGTDRHPVEAFSASIYVDGKRAADVYHDCAHHPHRYERTTPAFRRFLAFARGPWADRQPADELLLMGQPPEDLLVYAFAIAHDHRRAALRLRQGLPHIITVIWFERESPGGQSRGTDDAAGYATVEPDEDAATVAAGLRATRWHVVRIAREIRATEASGPYELAEPTTDD